MIFDFTTKADGNNFSIVDPADWLIHNKTVDGMEEEPVMPFAYPQRYGGTIADDAKFKSSAEDEGLKAFGFDHSQAQA